MQLLKKKELLAVHAMGAVGTAKAVDDVDPNAALWVLRWMPPPLFVHVAVAASSIVDACAGVAVVKSSQATTPSALITIATVAILGVHDTHVTVAGGVMPEVGLDCRSCQLVHAPHPNAEY